MKIYSMQELVAMYGLSKVAIAKSLNSHRHAINTEGKQNVWQEGSKNEWRLTEDGRQIWDKVRTAKKGSVAPVVVIQGNDKRVEELTNEVSLLKTTLMLTQNRLEQEKDKRIALLEEKNEAVKLLADFESNRKIAEAESKQKDERIEALEDEKQANLMRAMSAEAEVARYKNLNFLERFIYLIKGQ